MCRSPGNTVVTIGLAIASLVRPGDAAAQSVPVFRALAGLQAALDGPYGDEGSEVARRLGDLSEAVANWDRSIREAEQRLRAQPGGSPEEAAAAHEALGSAFLERSRFADAVAEFEAASRFAPQRAAPHLLRGLALDAMFRSDTVKGDASAAFRQAWSLDPDNPVTAYLAIARSAIDDADRSRARETLLRIAQGAVRGGRPPTPSPFLRPARPADRADGSPSFPLARYADGFALALQGQFDEAITRLREAAGRDPLVADPASQTEGLRQSADGLRRGTLRAALAALKKVVEASPRSSEAHRMLATASVLAGDTRAGVEHLEAALRIRPDDERSWIALANTHADTGSLSEAARTLEAAIAAIPDSGGLRWRLAGLLVRLDRHADALEQYSEAERRPAVSGRAPLHQAVAALASLQQQDVARAAAAVDRRVRANLNDAPAHRELAGLYVKQGRQEEAFAELAIAAWLDPDDPLTLVALGHSFMADRRDGDAVAALGRAVTLQPGLREARYALAQALTRVERRVDARQQLMEFERLRAEATARERQDLDIDAVKSTAVRQSAEGRFRQSADTWRKVLAAQPAVAQNYLELAEALVRAGALEESLQYFVKTAELDGVAEVHARLADVLARLGRKRESALARETYEELRLEDFRRRSRR